MSFETIKWINTLDKLKYQALIRDKNLGKFHSRKSKSLCEICIKLTIKTTERRLNTVHTLL